ncbi:MAG: hypothetical protein L0J06_02260 [Yaniella sp.]|nr:hypothetical protein [Yaniella sp.]
MNIGTAPEEPNGMSYMHFSEGLGEIALIVIAYRLWLVTLGYDPSQLLKLGSCVVSVGNETVM